MDEQTLNGWVPKKQLTMGQTVTLISVGCFMVLLSIVIPTETPSTAHTMKVIVGFLGVVVGMVGLIFRPVKTPKNSKG